MIVFPHPPPEGGPGTFQKYLENFLMQKDIKIEYARFFGQKRPKVIFVNLGTRRLMWLVINKIRGVPIIHRLDGVNWRYKLEKNKFSRSYWYGLIINYLMNYIRKYLADHIIYQSKFIKNEWESRFGKSKKNSTIIYNGTDLNKFKKSSVKREINIIKIICVEGNVQADQITLKTIEYICKSLEENNINYIVDIYGGITDPAKKILTELNFSINIKGKVERSEIAKYMSQYDIFLTLEINPPCPNSVIEAMASGLAILGYNTGSLKELIQNDCGCLIPFTGNNWTLTNTDFSLIEGELNKIVNNHVLYGLNARNRAVKYFDKKIMLNKYYSIISNMIKSVN